MEQLTFDLDSSEGRELVLPPTKAQRLLAVLNAAIVRSGLDIRVTHINVRYAMPDSIGFWATYKGRANNFMWRAGYCPNAWVTWSGDGEVLICEYGIVPCWSPFDRGDYGNMIYVGE